MFVSIHELKSQIASDGLNNSTTLFTFNVPGAYFTGNSAAGDRPASVAQAFEGTHARGVVNGSSIMTSSDINTSGYTGIQLGFRLASHSVGSTGNGADAGDIVTVEVSPDGGTNYYSTIRVLGNGNAYWNYTATGIATTAYDGNATSVDFSPAAGGLRTTDGLSTVTVTGLPAVSNLRVRITMLNNAAQEKWLIDDFRVTGTLATPCSGTPAPGNTNASANPVVGGGTTALSLTGTLTGSGLTYQWQQSADGSTGWTDISGANSATYTASPTAKTWYRCTVTCSGSSASSTPVEVNLTYCASVPTSNDASGISSVTVGSATFAVADVMYLDYTASIPNLTQGTTVTSSITFATGFTYDTHIWIDFNDDFVFDNTTEKVFTGVSTNTNPTTLTTNFNISPTATLGQHRMRIGTADAGQATPTPCYSGTFGVTIDMNVNIIAASASPFLTITGTTAHGSVCPTTAATSQTYTITNTGASAATGLSVVSSDPQFVVSALSSTTVAGGGGTVTYVVTFTPSSAGAKTATITVASTTGGSNSPTSNLTGTGTASVSPVSVSTAATAIGTTTATLGATSGTTFGVCPTTTGKGFVISQTSVNSNPTVGGTGVTNEIVTPLGTTGVAYTKAVTGLLPSTHYSFTSYVFDGTTYTYGTVLTFTTATAPANDLCVSATPLTVNTAAVSGTMVNASVEVPFIAGDNKKDVWYQFTPDCIGKYTITLGGFSGDLDVQVLTACGTTTILTGVTSTANPEILTTGTLSASTTYYIRIRAFNVAGESSTFNLAVNNQVAIVTQPANATVTSGSTANFASSLPANATAYQWQVNTGSGWSNVSTGTGGTTNSYTTEPTALAMSGYQYRVIISNGTCSSVTSNPATLTVNNCVPSSSNTLDYISSFVTTGAATNINRTSTLMAPGGYADLYSTTTLTQEVGLSVSFTETYAGGDHGFNIWVDWNNDGVFAVAEKVYGSAALNGTGFSGSFTIPLATTPGDYRMRIRAQYNTSDPASCSSITYGEALDFKLTATSPCVSPATPATPTSNSPQCLPTGVTVSQVGTAPVGETWYWQTTATGTAVAAINSATTYSVTTPGTTTIYLRSRNNTTLCWSTASSVSVTVNAVTAVSTQPANQNAFIGSSATFSVAAAGGGLSYQWQINTGSGWNDVTLADGTGGNTASFTTVATTLAMTGYTYRVNITGTCGSATSNGLATLTVSACAGPIWEENFDLGCVSANHIPTIDADWIRFSGTANNFAYSPSGLSYSNYPASGIGGSANFTTGGDDIQRVFSTTGINSGSVFASFLINMNSGTSTTDDFFVALNGDAANTYHGRVYIKKEGTQFRLGIGKQSSGSSDANTSLLNFGTTYLVVVKYEFISGGVNDPFRLWVFSGTAPTTEPGSGFISATVTGTDATNLKAFSLRQTNTPRGLVDGIRVATTWESLFCGASSVVPTSVTYTWNGTTNSSWDSPCNWTPNGVPTATDNIIINNSTPTLSNNLLITDSRTINDFTLNGTGNFEMNASGVLTINGNVTYGGTATASLNCASTVWITNSGTQPIPPLNYGNLEVLGGNRVFPNGDTIGICSGFNVNPSLHTYTVTGSTVRYFSSGSGWVMIPFTYNNLHFDGTGDFSLGYSATNANKTYNVLGDFTQTKGIVYIGENGSATATLNVSGNTTISGGTLVVNQTTGGTGILNMLGNLTVNGGILTSNVNTNAYLRFTGTGQQDVSLTGTNQIFHTEINKASGFVNLLTDYQTRRTLTMTAGNIVTNTNLLELGQNTTNKGTLTHTSGYVVGRMRRWFNGTNSGNATGLFPMGVDESGLKNRFSLIEYTTAPATGGHLTVEFKQIAMGLAGLTIPAVSTGGFGYDVSSTEDQGYWQIDDQGTLTDGLYTISCTGEGFATITDLSQITLLKRVGGGNWFCPGTHQAPTGSIAVPTAIRSGVSGWSNFGFGAPIDVNPLPVELVQFVATCDDDKTHVTWSTASEQNAAYFDVEESVDGINWRVVSKVNAIGNSVQLNGYETELAYQSGTTYYRLNQVDLDGKSTLSGVIVVACGDAAIQVYPNPTNEWIFIQHAPENVEISLLAMDGRKVKQETVQQAQSGISLQGIEQGTYHLQVRSNGQLLYQTKVVKIDK